MPEINAIFLDDGGVLNNDALRGTEWRRLIAEFLIPRLGGTPAEWAEANIAVFTSLVPVSISGPQAEDYLKWYENSYLLHWLRGMAAYVGVAVPADDAECVGLAWKAIRFITPRVRASYPGSADAVRKLHKMGFRLFTASSGTSIELEGCLNGMEIRKCFDTLYGADLVNVPKNSSEYYRKVFDHARILPNRALVIDDKLQCLAWAKELGAATCLVGAPPEKSLGINFNISALAELPILLRKKM